MTSTTSKGRGWLRDLAISLSLANLCCLGGWIQLERAQNHGFDYFRKQPLADSYLLAHLVLIFLLGLVMWLGIRLLRFWGNPVALKIAQCSFLFLLVLPLRVINAEFPSLIHGSMSTLYAKTGLILLGATIGTGPFLIALYRNRVVLRIAESAVLVLAPLLPVLVASAAVTRYQAAPEATFRDRPLSRALPGKRLPRIVWIVFDELDERIAFLNRPKNLEMPELDRLAGQSVRARSAYPPSTATMVSLPALITGRAISQVEPTGADDLKITFRGARDQVMWSSQANVFSRARQAGANTALVGWHNPYCRILGWSLTACAWEPNITMNEGAYEPDTRAIEAASNELRALASAVPLLPKFGPIRPERIAQEEIGQIRQQHRDAYFNIRDRALRAVVDPRLSFILIHWPIPHPLGIYNRSERSFTAIERSSYLDNLALTDRTMGDVRKKMEDAGMWDSTVVLVSSDHPLRPYEWNYRLTWTEEDKAATGGKESPIIPFLLKLPGQRKGIAYKPPFNTVLSQDLLLALLHGEISTSRAAVSWLDRNRLSFAVR